YYRTAVGMLLGVRGELDGLRVAPQLPADWPGARVWRRWRGAEFDISMTRQAGTAETTLQLDGKPLAGPLIAPQAPGSRHEVTVILPGQQSVEATRGWSR
ncbi:MAG: NdvB protein, partial [Planctomycetota bacterium]